MPDLRIVVPCRNADRTLPGCVAAIFRSEHINAETVIVNDGLTDTRAWEGNGSHAAVVATPGGIGAGAARNTGARGFRGSILVFVDADVELASSGTIAALVAPLTGDEAEATVGCYAASGRDGVVARYKECYLAYTYGRGGALRNSFWTALCAVKTSSFNALGGFPECYRGAGPEDIDFGISLTSAGGRIRAVPEARGYHRSPMTLRELLSNDFRKGSEDVYVHWKRKIPLTHNRHAGAADIAAVAFASALPVLLCAGGSVPGLIKAACAFLYLAFRSGLLFGAFGRGGAFFFSSCTALTFVCDLVRGGAVIAGTALACAESLAGRGLNPLIRHVPGPPASDISSGTIP